MKTNKISESGIIGNDGRLRMPMDRLNAFFAEHKGERVIVRFDAAACGASVAQLAYYFNYIVPTIQAALFKTGERLSERQTDKWIREQAPFFFETFIPATPEQLRDGYLGTTDIRGVRELSVTEMSSFLEWLKQFAAENLNVYIEDPKTL